MVSQKGAAEDHPVVLPALFQLDARERLEKQLA